MPNREQARTGHRLDYKQRAGQRGSIPGKPARTCLNLYLSPIGANMCPNSHLAPIETLAPIEAPLN